MNPQYRASVKAVVTAVSLAAVLNLYSTARGEESIVTEIMPVAQQNSVVRQYCEGCHSDALMYGGLSVEHFDAAHPEPSLAAMLLSKVTNGQSPRVVNAAIHGSDSDATILGFMKASAMGAAGKGVPDEKTQVAFAKALSTQAAGAERWDSHWTEKPPTESRELTATIVRELPST